MAAPPSQKYRTIGFLLTGGDGADVHIDLNIRPEDLQRPEPSRLTVQQTLGGAWADLFGRGIAEITLSGTLGWRGGPLLSGEDLFFQLRETIFVEWHRRIQALVDLGQDANGVQLYFTDNLDNNSILCAVRRFTLRRSRSSPLLIRYNIQLVQLAEAISPDALLDNIINALSNPLGWIAGYTGLTNTIGQINAYATMAINALSAVGASVGNFINVGTGLLQSVATAANEVKGAFAGSYASLLAVGALYSAAGANAFSALAANDTLPPDQLLAVQAVASGFNDAACTMGIFTRITSYTDLSGMLGASGCSSTAGGQPWSPFVVNDINPFDSLVATLPDVVRITPAATAALTSLQTDPLVLMSQPELIGSLLGRAAAGVQVAA
jgi:hypothetical protein